LAAPRIHVTTTVAAFADRVSVISLPN
jgi:hypothetical protein